MTEEKKPWEGDTPNILYADLRHPTYEDATKDQVRDWMHETAWLLAENQGAKRECRSCQTVMRRLDRRQHDSSTCLAHNFGLPFREHPNPWRLAEERLDQKVAAEHASSSPSDTDSTMTKLDMGQAEYIVNAIFAELNSRRGIGHELRGIHEDKEVYDEMHTACVKRIMDLPNKGPAPFDKYWYPKP